ncbi:MAG: hypothetical protein EOP45_03105 [Sphingobacteriaceae bacterium]|nr:MAG: hypothetical protein EOP45_03105 [Sphingobacteriaceae bacterium]
MKFSEKDGNKDAIMLYLKNPDADIKELSDKQKQLLDFYTDAYSILRNYGSVPDAIAVLLKLASNRGEPISKSTARRYVYDAQDVYGYASKTKPEAIRHYATEVIKDAIAMARDQNKPDVMIAGAEKLMKVSGADEVEGFNAEMLEQHIVEIGLDQKGQKLIGDIVAMGSVDLDSLVSNVMNSMATDAEVIPNDATGN